MSRDSDKLKKQLRTKRPPVDVPDYENGLGCGSTLLNLACTGCADVAFVKGEYNFFVGDSDSGKTFICANTLAEAANNPAFDDYRLVFDNVEGGLRMDVKRLFGQRLLDRLEAPRYRDGQPVYSSTIEEFYFHLFGCLDLGPVVYVLDSMDGLSSKDEEAKTAEQMKQVRRQADGEGGDKIAGSYGDGKAKKNSALLRQALHRIRESRSIVVIIDQTRDNLKVMSYEPKTHSGGHALRFYAQVVMWSSVKKKLTTEVNSKKRHIGNECLVNVKRSRNTGHGATVAVPIYYSSGIDDLGSCIDYLVDERHWAKAGGTVTAPEFDHKGSRDALIRLIEDENKEDRLRDIVADVWQAVEEKCAVRRKKRYE